MVDFRKLSEERRAGRGFKSVEIPAKPQTDVFDGVWTEDLPPAEQRFISSPILKDEEDQTRLSFEFICGAAGCGKSTLLRKRMETDHSYALLTATTGIAAINLGEGITTINSLLGFFDEDSLRRAFNQGWLIAKIKKIAKSGGRPKVIVIDEVSMLSANTLDIIVDAFIEADRQVRAQSFGEAPGLVLCGDFLQLPPVNGRFAFHSKHWKKFEANTTKLTKIWRQSDPKFMEALHLARLGRGVDCASTLYHMKIPFLAETDRNFEGTTLFPTNSSVEQFNKDRLARLETPTVMVNSIRVGKAKGEWKEIPERLELKKGATVLILANEPETFRYVNGDSAEILEIVRSEDPKSALRPMLRLRLLRNNYEFTLGDIIRQNTCYEDVVPDSQRVEGYEPFWDSLKKRWITGEIRYMPVRLGWASTIHKAQGLSLDNVQIDVRHYWCGQPAMIYVALSRSRTPEGIRIVGTPSTLANRVSTSNEVKAWVT